MDNWIKDFPYDFAVPGAASALTAFVKSVLSKTYLLHYGSDFLPFLELLSGLKDRDKSWALKVDHPSDETDDSSSQSDEEQTLFVRSESPEPTNQLRPVSSANGSYSTTPLPPQPQPPPSRERKSSLPLTSKAFILSSSSSNSTNAGLSDASQFERNLKTVLKRLVYMSQELNTLDPSEIAQEITLLQVRYFLQIKVRHSCVTPNVSQTFY